MKLAASNIGWDPTHTKEMLPQLPGHGVEGLVIAPTMVWPDAPNVSAKEAVEFRKRVEDAGLEVAGMQSLTFGLKDAALSGTPQEQQRLSEHLKRHAELAGHLGATSLIFGSPGFRKEVRREDALSVFSSVASTAADNGTKLCIEPLSGYGNNFVTTTREGIEFVQEVGRYGSPDGVGLHLDAAAIAGKHDFAIASELEIATRSVGINSFDASAPELLPLTSDEIVPHEMIGRALSRVAYDGYVSLEMRAPAVEDPIAAYLNEVDFARQQYSTTA